MVYWSDDQFRNICVKIFVGLATAPSVWSVQVWELKWTWHNKISSHRLLGLELATNEPSKISLSQNREGPY